MPSPRQDCRRRKKATFLKPSSCCLPRRGRYEKIWSERCQHARGRGQSPKGMNRSKPTAPRLELVPVTAHNYRETEFGKGNIPPCLWKGKRKEDDAYLAGKDNPQRPFAAAVPLPFPRGRSPGRWQPTRSGCQGPLASRPFRCRRLRISPGCISGCRSGGGC